MKRSRTNCGTELPENAGFCPKYGTKIEIPYCPACGKEIDFGAAFCIHCGQPLGESREEAQAAVLPVQNDFEGGVARPDELDLAIQNFSWSYKAAMGRLETTVNTVTVQIANDVVRILEAQGSVWIKKEPKRFPEKVVSLANIESVRVRPHWSVLFGLPLLLCIPLLLYGWLASRIDWITAVFCLVLVAVVAFRYAFQIHHHRLIIVDRDKNKVVLRGKDKSVLQQVEEAIVNCTGLMPSAQEKKHPALKIIATILVLLVLIFAAICGFEEIYLRRMFPNQIMLNPDVIAYAQPEISYNLAPENYDITVEITGGNLEKRTSLPRYENDVFTYFYVNYVYEITVSDGAESAGGTVTVDASFEADPFNCKPNDILLNTFTYSDNLTDFAEGLIPPPETITPKNLIGRWELQYLKISETVLYDSLQQNIYFQFFEDHTSQMVSGVVGDAVYSTWETSENMVIITDSSGLKSIGVIQDGLLCFEDAATIMRFEQVPSVSAGTPESTPNSVGAFDDIVGTWQDREGYGAYLFIGYGDTSKQSAYAYLVAAEEFEVELSSGEDGESYSGRTMRYGNEQDYAMNISRYKYWLEVSIYIPDSEDDITYIQFVPADPDTCPYNNPYHTD